MKLKKTFITALIAFGMSHGALLAEPAAMLNGVVNFTTCISESKYGKREQAQFEKIRGQWSALIEETEKELKDISGKFEDPDYLDGLSPEAEEELKVKYRTLYEDMNKYQSQLNQVLNQANYYFVQRMNTTISDAAETVAKDKKLNMVMNKEACFYYKSGMDVTNLVIKQMNKNYDRDVKEKKIVENEAAPEPVADAAEETEPEETGAE